MTDNVKSITGIHGLEREDYDAETDATHVAIPIRIIGASSPEDAERRAEKVGREIAALVSRTLGAEWVTSPLEGAYALLANLATALATLDDRDRMTVLAVSPALAELRALTALWVVDHPCGHPVAVTGPGEYVMPTQTLAEAVRNAETEVATVDATARIATLDDLARMTSALDAGHGVIAGRH